MDVKPASRTKKLLQPVHEESSLPFALWLLISFISIQIIWFVIDKVWPLIGGV